MPANNTTTRRKANTAQPTEVFEPNKRPPQALELEESVIGALMLDKDAYSTVSDLLQPEAFYVIKHQLIFEAIRALSVKEEPIDILTVSEKLKAMGNLERAGGLYYLNELTTKIASTAHLRYHAQIIAQKATARDLISYAANIEEKAFDDTQDIETLLSEAEGKIFEITQRSQKRDVTQIDPVITEAFARMHKASKNEGNISGVASGFVDLDKMTSGWQASDLIIIAARPAMGKTAFVLSMAKNIAVDYNTPVAMFSLEMSNVQLVNRLIMNVCEIEGEKIKNGRLTQAEWDKLETKINALKGAPLYVDDTPALSVFELKSKAKKLVREHGVKLIIIDYLQLMNASGMQFGSREQEVSIISRNLKTLAKELDIPIIALSQLNRGVESRTGVEGKKPQLSDLRESGAIEQDADMVCFIHRPEYYHLMVDDKGNSLQGVGQIIIAKHRNGATGEVNLRFRSIYAKFQNIDNTTAAEEYAALMGNTTTDTKTISYQSSINTMSADGAELDDNNMPF